MEFFFAETQKLLITSCRRESQDSEEFGGVLGIDFEDGGKNFLSWPKFHQVYHLPFPLLTTLTTQRQAHTPLNLGNAAESFTMRMCTAQCAIQYPESDNFFLLQCMKFVTTGHRQRCETVAPHQRRKSHKTAKAMMCCSAQGE